MNNCEAMTKQTKVRSTDEALKLALEALVRVKVEFSIHQMDAAITAIKEALAQPDYNATSDQRLMEMQEQENKAFNDGILEGVLRERAFRSEHHKEFANND